MFRGVIPNEGQHRKDGGQQQSPAFKHHASIKSGSCYGEENQLDGGILHEVKQTGVSHYRANKIAESNQPRIAFRFV